MIPPYPTRGRSYENDDFAGLGLCYQLYNIKEDIGQQKNLAEKEPQRLRQMMIAFEKLKRETGKKTDY